MAVPNAPAGVEFMSVAQVIDGSELPPLQVLGATSRYLQFVVHIVPEAPIWVNVVGAT